MAESFFDKVYKNKTMHTPDVLSCLANLSNDEVFTPPEVVNQMLDMLPQELFKNPDTTFLDPACKTGVFLREIAKRLLVGLEDIIPDLQERIDHIFHKQLYGIAITELTSLLSRRSVYCSKYPNGQYSISRFDNPEGNIRFKKIQHTWKDGKCRFCGASQTEYDRSPDKETHAYEFIHMINLQEAFDMPFFDVIISNPPYQLSDGGNGASASPLYHKFVEQAIKLSPKYLSMIIPSRWYAGGKGLDVFRNKMLRENHISALVDIANSSDCFPGVNVAGGICYFLWENNYSGDCNVKNMEKGIIVSEEKRSLNEYSYFVRNNLALSIVRKVAHHNEKMMSHIVFSRNYFNLPTTVKGYENQALNTISVLTSKGTIYIHKNDIEDKDKILDKYKVIITYAMSGGNKPTADGNYQILSSLKMLEPNVACSETYLILGYFDSKEEAKGLVSYMSSKFARFLLLQALSSIHITKDKFCFVPIQDFSKPWNDDELYLKYGLDKDEIDLIESMIRPIDLSGGGK